MVVSVQPPTGVKLMPRSDSADFVSMALPGVHTTLLMVRLARSFTEEGDPLDLRLVSSGTGPFLEPALSCRGDTPPPPPPPSLSPSPQPKEPPLPPPRPHAIAPQSALQRKELDSSASLDKTTALDRMQMAAASMSEKRQPSADGVHSPAAASGALAQPGVLAGVLAAAAVEAHSVPSGGASLLAVGGTNAQQRVPAGVTKELDSLAGVGMLQPAGVTTEPQFPVGATKLQSSVAARVRRCTIRVRAREGVRFRAREGKT